MEILPTINTLHNFNSRKEWEDHIWLILIETLTKSDSVKETGIIFSMLLTENEKKQIINRASAISLLGQGKSYQQIGELLWLSPNTISSINKSLQTKEGYISRDILNKKQGNNKKSLTKKELDKAIFNSWLKSFFILPPPPLPHPRLIRQLKQIKNLTQKF